MKTSTYTFAFVTLILSGFQSVASTLTANGDEGKRNVPTAPKVITNENLNEPKNLSFIKAKNAFVPNAPFSFGSPTENVFELVVISPKLTMGDPGEAPVVLGNIKAKNAFVPLAPQVQGNAHSDFPEGL